MASASPPQTGRILAKAMRDLFRHDRDDDCTTTIRCNGREFHVEMSPFYICASPAVESRYRKFLAALRDKPGEEDADAEESEASHPEDVVDEFHAWLIEVFEPIFLEVAPDIPPSFDPVALAADEAHPLLSEYFFPEEYRCRLEAEDNKPYSILMRDAESGFCPAIHNIDPDLAHRLHQYVKFFDCSAVEVSFKKPTDALSEMPNRVLTFASGDTAGIERELEAHLEILKSPLPSEARIARLHGVVVEEEDDWLLGILLTYIDHRREDGGLLFEDHLLHTPIPLRQRWARQIQETVGQLHRAGVVWGDAKAENVMIDKNNDAWLIDFGGGYTEGWIDADKSGTVEGDLQGVAKIVEHLSSEEYESLSDSDWEEV